ncbi:hypothetical protein DSM3645_07291 [Blastopirellula marina DSM 3645]|uniref:Lipoprotein n=2 Tax=Blastopirellula marina TaxID=124 RepID=A3ZYK6_9BACT|nr:hypothetical protein DSM3645_07291 [Blastopirellula marina DSM 3645]
MKFIAVVALTLVGCMGTAKDPFGRQAIEGTITLDGQPLASGSIVFMPEEQGPFVSGAEIHKGTFSMPPTNGLPAGRYKVSITSVVPLPASDVKSADEMTMDFPTKSLVPAKYNSQTTLISEVSDESQNVFTFDLKSK